MSFAKYFYFYTKQVIVPLATSHTRWVIL